MSTDRQIHVYSEVQPLKKVLLHRPGKEVENLMPDILDRLLFDDIPYLKVAQEEHDAFASILRKEGVEVFYLEDLMAETLADSGIKEAFINQFIEEAGVYGKKRVQAVKEYLASFSDNRTLVDQLMAGIRKTDIGSFEAESLTDMVSKEYPFLIDPMPNLYFTRDPFATIGYGVSINHMRTVTRNRETIFGQYIFDHHPTYKNSDLPKWYSRDEKTYIEGGDQLVLTDKVLAIGISERTHAKSIEKLAEKIFEKDQFETILALSIPEKRAFMHLDTVFTMIDHNVFTIHPEVEAPMTVFALQRTEGNQFTIEKQEVVLEEILKKYLQLDEVTLLRCGDGNLLDAAREQWNDGSNTLAIRPGEVVVYSRNHVTNKVLEEHGIKLHIMPSSELSRGRGGPRCMSMPLWRE